MGVVYQKAAISDSERIAECKAMDKHSYKQLYSFLLLWGSQTVSQLGTAMTDYTVIIWVYSRKGTASSVTLLTVCTFLPTIFFRFLAGSMVDRQNKKRIMLIADLLAACGTLAIFVLDLAPDCNVNVPAGRLRYDYNPGIRKALRMQYPDAALL